MEQQCTPTPSEYRLLTEAEVCEFLRIKPRQLYAWRMQGLIPYIKIGKALRFRRSDVVGAIEAMSVGGQRHAEVGRAIQLTSTQNQNRNLTNMNTPEYKPLRSYTELPSYTRLDGIAEDIGAVVDYIVDIEAIYSQVENHGTPGKAERKIGPLIENVRGRMELIATKGQAELQVDNTLEDGARQEDEMNRQCLSEIAALTEIAFENLIAIQEIYTGSEGLPEARLGAIDSLMGGIRTASAGIGYHSALYGNRNPEIGLPQAI